MVIRSPRVLLPGGLAAAEIDIEGDRIAGVRSPHTPDTSRAPLLFPGIIDPHVHINEPGRTEWEGFVTATRAAIAGGVTSLIEMPLNASPVTTNVSAFKEKIKAANGKLHCNCGFWGGVIPGNE